MSAIAETADLDDVDNILEPAGESRPVSTGEMLMRVVMADNAMIQGAVDAKSSTRAKVSMAPMLGLLMTGPVVFLASRFLIDILKDVGTEKVDLTIPEIDLEKFVPAGSEILRNMFAAPELEQVSAVPAEDAGISYSSGAANNQSVKGLPRPTDEVHGAIRRAAIRTGRDYHTLYALAGTESAFNADVKASTSSAKGLMQFTTPTWKYLTEKVFPELGYTLQDRIDPEKSAILASLYLDMIRKSLFNGTGREPTIGDLYLGYFMGPGGAIKFISAKNRNPEALSADIFPKEANANPSLFYAKNGRPFTLQETYDKLTGRITKYYVASKQQEAVMTAQASNDATVTRADRPKATVQANAVPEAKENKGKQHTPVLVQETAQAPQQEQPMVIAQAPVKPSPSITYARDRNQRIVAIPS